MSAPLRFLVFAVAGWTVLRASTLGVVPGAEAFRTARAEVVPPPIVATEFPPIDPLSGVIVPAAAEIDPRGYPPSAYPAAVPIYYPVPAAYYPRPHYAPAPRRDLSPIPARSSGYTPIVPVPDPVFYAPIPSLDEWPLSRLASAYPARRSSAPVQGTPPVTDLNRIDRLQLSAWALLRGRPGQSTLASGGTLGGSQAGARLTYALNRQLAVSLRSSSPVGGAASGGEVAAGVRLTPLRSIPVSLTAERRQAIGRHGGRSDFALFLEGGVYQRPMPWGLGLDAYAQAGVVGVRRHDLFADGAFTLTRPVRGPFSAGFGMWGGVQPGLYRIDAGPRLSMRVRHNMRVDLDWRQRLAGEAMPGSGPALTLSGNF